MRRIGRYWAISSGLLLFAACGGGRYTVSNNNNENNASDCGNGVVEAEEACDGTALDGWTCDLLGYKRGDIGCSASCELDVSGCEALPGCGNGVLDPEESCDGSNLGGGTCEDLGLGGGTLGCTPACRFDLAACDQPPVCGNGEVEYGEACDDGNVESCDGCSSHCRLDGCGNGVVDCEEQCDDGSTQPGDGCGPICRFEECGNGIADPGEVCDDGNEAGGDGCSADCLSDESCSNGITDVEAGEQCDDGNLDSGDGCSATCLLEGCGNGVLDPFEVCDDGNEDGGDGCSADCLSDETCGNSIVDTAAGETCDDGNQTPGDGCSATCLVEGCGNGVLDQGEACDDGNIVSGDGCSADCHSDETCPNGVLDTAAGEECDTNQLGGQTCLTRGYYGGNLACGPACAFDESGCSGQCADGVVDVPLEECDDGNTTVGDGCNASCQAEANVCLVDHDLGVIGAGDTSNVAVSTLASHAAYATTCGGAGGREQVLRFTTLTTLDVTIGYMGQTGHHVLGVFRDMSMACDAQQVTCFDTAGSSSGNTGPVTLTAGTYFVIVDANLAGDEGTLQIAVSAAASTEPCIVEFGFDGVYRGCEIPYSYEDISATGTLVGADDEAEWTVSIGFPFNFYGVSYNQVTASTNGALAFNGGYIVHYNGCLPDDFGSQQPGIAVLWDDLDSTTGGAQGVFTELRGTAPSRRFIVQWVTEHYLSGQTTGTASFQVVLHETTGHVEMRYLDTDFANASYNAGVSATVMSSIRAEARCEYC